MNSRKNPVKRFLIGGIGSAALILPLTFWAGTAQASMGSRDVRGNLPSRATEVMGTQPQAKPTVHHIARVQPTNLQNLTPAERAINPVLNPDKPINLGSH